MEIIFIDKIDVDVISLFWKWTLIRPFLLSLQFPLFISNTSFSTTLLVLITTSFSTTLPASITRSSTWLCLVFGGQAVCPLLTHKARLPKQRHKSQSPLLTARWQCLAHLGFQQRATTIWKMTDNVRINNNEIVYSRNTISPAGKNK